LSVLTCIDENAMFYLNFSLKQCIAHALSHSNVDELPTSQEHENINSFCVKLRTRLINNVTRRAR